MTDDVLEITGLSLSYGSTRALRDVHLTLRDREILTLIGPSGCGKTSILRAVAGLELPEEGTIVINGNTMTGENVFVPPEQRNVGFVFQDLALFPHLTVKENVEFGLSEDANNREHRLNDVLDLVGLKDTKHRYPNSLSGGQKQRVALARSLVMRPSVLLMDEPFSNLDKGLRERLRREVRDILKESEIPTLFVTHHQEEAIYLGDRTAVMSEGTIEQVDRPEEIVVRPGSRFVAEFLGPTEFLPARKTSEGIETEIQTLSSSLVEAPGTETFDLMVRADDIQIESAENGNANGVVEDAEFLGGFFRYKIRLSSGRYVYSLLNHSQQLRPDTPVNVKLDPGHPLVGFESSE